MFKTARSICLMRWGLCVFISGFLLLGQLPVLPPLCSLSSTSVLHSSPFNFTSSFDLNEVADIDDGADLLLFIGVFFAFSVFVGLLLPDASSGLLTSAAGVSLPPLARPPPVASLC